MVCSDNQSLISITKLGYECLTATKVAGRYRVPRTESAFSALPSFLLCSANRTKASFSRRVCCAMSLRDWMSFCSAVPLLRSTSSLRYSRILKSFATPSAAREDTLLFSNPNLQDPGYLGTWSLCSPPLCGAFSILQKVHRAREEGLPYSQQLWCSIPCTNIPSSLQPLPAERLARPKSARGFHGDSAIVGNPRT